MQGCPWAAWLTCVNQKAWWTSVNQRAHKSRRVLARCTGLLFPQCLVLRAMQSPEQEGRHKPWGPQHMAPKGSSKSICGMTGLLNSCIPLTNYWVAGVERSRACIWKQLFLFPLNRGHPTANFQRNLRQGFRHPAGIHKGKLLKLNDFFLKYRNLKV